MVNDRGAQQAIAQRVAEVSHVGKLLRSRGRLELAFVGERRIHHLGATSPPSKGEDPHRTNGGGRFRHLGWDESAAGNGTISQYNQSRWP